MSLVLGHGQVALLSQSRFERRLGDLLAQADPAARGVFATPEGRLRLKQQCRKAATYGLTAELEIARYVIAAWLLGADFDTRFEAIAQILATDRMSPAGKAEAIERISLAVLGGLAEGRG